MGRNKSIMLLVTYGCNLRCSYCYEPKIHRRDMSVDDARRYITDIVGSLTDDYDSFDVQFMGGEPLMVFPLIREISEWVWNHPLGKKPEMLFAATNGTLVNDEMRRWFAANSHRICLGLSYDGTSGMQNVNRSGSARDVDLKFFSTLWPRQAVKTTISPATIGSLAAGVLWLHNHGFARVNVDLAMGRNIGWTTAGLVDLKEQLDLLADYYLANPEVEPCSLMSVDIFNMHNPSVPLAKHCSCGSDLVCVDTDGTHYACHLFSPVACNDADAEIGRKIDFMEGTHPVNDNCQSCSLALECPFCYGMNFQNTGDPTGQDPWVCASFQVVYLQNCRFRLRRARQSGDARLASDIECIINNFK